VAIEDRRGAFRRALANEWRRYGMFWSFILLIVA